LLSVLEDHHQVQKGLEEYGLHVLVNEKRLYLLDTRERFFISLEAILMNREYNRFARLWNVPERNEIEQSPLTRTGAASRALVPVHPDKETLASESQANDQVEPDRETANPISNISLDIHQDVDDEALHGRRRNKEKDNKKRSIR
jgi:hypothetical protein